MLRRVGGEEPKRRGIPLAKVFEEMEFKIYATEHTAEALQATGINSASVLNQIKGAIANPKIPDLIQDKKIDWVVNAQMGNKQKSCCDFLTDGYYIRRQAVEFNVPVITKLELASVLVSVLKQKNQNGTIIRSLSKYMNDLPWKL